MKLLSLAAFVLLAAGAALSPAGAISLRDAAAEIAKQTYFEEPITMKREVTDDGVAYYVASTSGAEVFALIAIGCDSELKDCEGFGLYAFGLKPVTPMAMSQFSDEATYAKLVAYKEDNTSTLIVEQIAEGASLETLRVQIAALEVAEAYFAEHFEKNATQIAYISGPKGDTYLAARTPNAKVDQALIERKARR